MTSSLSLPNQENQIILDQRARILARLTQKEAEAGTTLQLLSFLLGEEHYALEMARVQETQPLPNRGLSSIPCTPNFIIGAVNLRGRIYPVIDIAVFFGLPSRTLSNKAYGLLVRDNRGMGEGIELCLLADDIPQVVTVQQSEIQPPSATVSGQVQEYIRGIADNMLIILNLDRLLSDPRMIIHENV
ncbi:MAG: chemotaxis protein CheW [Pseudomonadota bacterium]